MPPNIFGLAGNMLVALNFMSLGDIQILEKIENLEKFGNGVFSEKKYSNKGPW